MPPLTAKGSKILGNMVKTYKSKKKAESVFYASINKGKIKGAEGHSKKKKKPKKGNGKKKGKKK